MSETETNTSGACELALDYVYGELDEARKRTFEEHLPTCARCQQEVASFGRVRTAVKRVMPAVEPTAPLGGALHAQLMHAAAQRKPRRGVLLAFPRKMVEHPALSAAAMFVLVGGAIAINWSRGKMAMPVAEHTAAPATAEQPALDAPKPTETGPQGNVELAKNVPAAEPAVAAKDKEAGDDAMVSLATGKGNYKVVQTPTAHRAVATPAPKKEAPARMKTVSTDGKMAKYDSGAFGDQLADSKNENGVAEGAAGGLAGGAIGGGGRGAPSAGAKSSAPSDLSRKKVAEKAVADEERKQQAQHGYAADVRSTTQQAAAPPPPQAPAPAAAVSTPSTATSERDYYRASQTVAKPAAPPRNYDGLRKQADDWAKSGRCEEAIKLYEELEKSAPQRLSPNDRVHWVRCLTERGRQVEAQQRLDELKQDKKVTNALIQDAERELNARRVETKKAKKAPPADRAPAQTQSESVQQKRAAEPAPQSPPDSTNTKIQNQKPTQSY